MCTRHITLTSIHDDRHRLTDDAAHRRNGSHKERVIARARVHVIDVCGSTGPDCSVVSKVPRERDGSDYAGGIWWRDASDKADIHFCREGEGIEHLRMLHIHSSRGI